MAGEHIGHDVLTFYSACESSELSRTPQVHQSVTAEKKGDNKLLN